ncbi:hypothetical protein PTSG_09547 [Salpingoeca rosetta]|uniref:Glycosyltransferase 61 catalytic domain-containing protein n=1 Tax=Salpingoeca rosetta (strain ATCC 50818 / BSB-021) TaxID=946362 RepID=F2ULB3_SALR5|nr:uncharacterized protein PTSG_09547 [Salpingoeca rosetta]EGD77912.1 hypothetical protein PTSG_09547 [Salpingoeca rosetta]|eukprot:XP_004989976.1 hypothetical protein PTSG_09547 [Salpingoeca rosetta]
MRLTSAAAVVVVAVACCCVSTTHADITEEYKRAALAFQQGRLGEAEAIFEQLSQLFPDVSAPFVNLAVVNEKKGNVLKAYRLFVQARNNFPDDYEVAISTCRFGANLLNTKLAVSPKMDSDVFLEACKDAERLRPNELEATSMLGNIYVLLMRFHEAIPILMRAEKIARNDEASHVQVLTNIALANLRGGIVSGAVDAVETLLTRYGHLPGISSTAGGVRSILLPYDEESVRLLTTSLVEFASTVDVSDETCQKGRWSMDMDWTKGKKHVKKTLLNRDTAGSKYSSSEEAHLVGSARNELKPYYTSYLERSIYFLAISKAVLWKSGAQLSTPCVFHTAAQLWNAEFTQAVSDAQYIQTKHIKHRVASTLPLKNMRNYYHWMLEGMVRLVYIQELVLDKPSFDDVKILVPDTHTAHVAQSLELLHIPKNRILSYSATDSQRWVFDQDFLLIDWMQPKVDSIGSLSKDVWSPFYPPREGILKLRERLRGALMEFDPDYDQKSSGVVFISRDKTKAVRSITNQDKLIAALAEAFGADRVTIHHGTEPLHEQLAMFATADLILGSHGAGLSNVVVAKPNTPVVFFPLKPHVDRTFGHLCTALNLPQWVLSDVSSYYYGNFGDLSTLQIKAIVRTAKKAYAHVHETERTGAAGDDDDDDDGNDGDALNVDDFAADESSAALNEHASSPSAPASSSATTKKKRRKRQDSDEAKTATKARRSRRQRRRRKAAPTRTEL